MIHPRYYLCCGWNGGVGDEQQGTGVRGGMFPIQVVHGFEGSVLADGDSWE